MDKLKILLFLGLCLSFSISFAQTSKEADFYFREFSYVKSAEAYKALVKKGDSSQITIERLADSYYNNAKIEEAKTWFAVLIEKYKNDVSSEYFYKYAQVLKASGDETKSTEFFNQFATLVPDDIRSLHIRNGLKLEENSLVSYKNLKNLDINTQYSDINGFAYNNALFIFSTRPNTNQDSEIYKWNKQPFFDIYNGQIDDSNEIIGLEKLKGSINAKYHEATLVITKDGNTMYFTRDNSKSIRLGKTKDETMNLKLYKAELVDGIWTNISELPFNSDEYSTGQPTLSPDEKTLYFISNMPGGIGGTDVYKVAIKENGFGKPINLGNNVNTQGTEMFPFITDDNTLYFSSNGRVGLGLLDVYKIGLDNILENSVYNLGQPINSNMDDFAFTIKDEKVGYLASNRTNGKGDDDIYAFDIEEICLESIAGTIYNKHTKEPLSNATVKLIDASGKVLETVTTKEDGVYVFSEQQCEQTFTVRADKPDFESDMSKVTLLSENGKVRKVDLNLFLQPLIIDNQIVVNPIYFDYDKYDILPKAAYELDKVISVLNNHPEMIIKIEAHTDSRGSDSYNRKLSDLRAKSTQDYIFSKGIEKNRIESAIGYGEAQLVNKCSNNVECSEEDHQANRRSLFIILNLNE
ncbi:OmpA family protein [Aurantibacter sp.]|uniref:OmpA family protein n=1 Tax=Aurantibacter sp. TaxID=2807103 RepID=UPI00326661F6